MQAALSTPEPTGEVARPSSIIRRNRRRQRLLQQNSNPEPSTGTAPSTSGASKYNITFSRPSASDTNAQQDSISSPQENGKLDNPQKKPVMLAFSPGPLAAPPAQNDPKAHQISLNGSNSSTKPITSGTTTSGKISAHSTNKHATPKLGKMVKATYASKAEFQAAIRQRRAEKTRHKTQKEQDNEVDTIITGVATPESVSNAALTPSSGQDFDNLFGDMPSGMSSGTPSQPASASTATAQPTSDFVSPSAVSPPEQPVPSTVVRRQKGIQQQMSKAHRQLSHLEAELKALTSRSRLAQTNTVSPSAVQDRATPTVGGAAITAVRGDTASHKQQLDTPTICASGNVGLLQSKVRRMGSELKFYRGESRKQEAKLLYMEEKIRLLQTQITKTESDLHGSQSKALAVLKNMQRSHNSPVSAASSPLPSPSPAQNGGGAGVEGAAVRRARLAGAVVEAYRMRQELNKHVAESQRLRKKVDEHMKTIESYTATVHSQKAALSANQAKMAQCTRLITSLRQQLESSGQFESVQAARIASLEEESKQMRAQVLLAQSALNDQVNAENLQLKEQLTSLTSRLGGLEERNTELAGQLATAESALSGTQAELHAMKEEACQQASLNARQQVLENREKALAEHTAQLKTQKSAVQAEMEEVCAEKAKLVLQQQACCNKQEKLVKLEAKLKANQTSLEERESVVNEQEKTLAQAQSNEQAELSRLRNELAEHQAMRTSAEKARDTAQDNLRATREKLKDTALDCEYLKAEMSSGVEEKAAMLAEVAMYKQQMEAMRAAQREHEAVRRRLHNQLLDLKGQVRVMVRVRPSLGEDPEAQGEHSVSYQCSHDTSQAGGCEGVLWVQNAVEKVGLHQKKRSAHQKTNSMESTQPRVFDDKRFSFNQVLSQGDDQETVYQPVSELIQSVLDGYNVSIIAYGQTGSGKTHTMLGELPKNDTNISNNSNISVASSTTERKRGNNSRRSTRRRTWNKPQTVEIPKTHQSPATTQLAPTSTSDSGETTETAVSASASERTPDIATSPLNANSGVIPRALAQLLTAVRESNQRSATQKDSNGGVTKCHTTLHLSCLEIYREKIVDLLGNDKLPEVGAQTKSLKVQTLQSGRTVCVGLHKTEITELSLEEALQLVTQAMSYRTTASTEMNARSSRSHCILQVHVRRHHYLGQWDQIPRRDPKHSSSSSSDRVVKLSSSVCSLVDLAGSERLKRTGYMKGDAASEARYAETRAINASLSALVTCFTALGKNNGSHVPYRNTQLTHVLKDCLQKPAKCVFIVAISPENQDVQESLCSLQFGTQLTQCMLGK